MKKTIALIILTTFFAMPASAAKLKVVNFTYDATGNDNYNRNGEYVVIKNTSGKKLNLRKWKVKDNDGHKLVLPRIILKKGQKLKIYTGEGTNKLKGKTKKVYWGHGWGLWNNDTDILRIKNRKNKTVLKYEY